MSARQPFIPFSRPASSADNRPQFTADIGNPLHRTLAAENKPLNLSGLLKKKPSQNAPSEIIPRPGTADILLQNPARRMPPQGLKIAAPTPTSPMQSAFLSANSFTFKPPALPGQAAMLPPSDDSASHGAHIPTETLPTARVQPARSFEALHDPAEARDPPGFGINTPGAKEGGPQRVLVDLVAGPAPRRASAKRGRAKRFEQDPADDDYGPQAKRYKYDPQFKDAPPAAEHGRQLEYPAGAPPSQSSRHSTPASHNSYGQRAGTASPDNETHAYGAPPALIPPARRRHQTPRESREHSGAPDSALNQLFGQDMDAHIAAHAAAYAAAKTRWAACTLEEWTAGADEVCGAFGRVLDFVKDHMTAKVKLYASLDRALEEHGTVLAGRDRVLADARASLVKEGTSVLGGV